MKILVADDSKTNLALLSEALKKLGHEVVAEDNGERAVDSFLQTNPDLVILDVMMEGMGGFECAKKIRSLSTEDWVPIIFLSASVDDESIAQGIDAGGDDYLAKPFSQITLAAKIKAMQRISIMRKKLYEATCQLSLLSVTDTLTGLYNRLQFNKVLTEKIAYARRHQVLLALLFIDLDNFKFINDHFGHHAGDLLLQEVAKRLKSCIRQYDFIARLGGDEFAIMINDVKNQQEITHIAQKILDTLAKNYHIGNHSFDMGCSIGIALYPQSGIEQETIVQHADIAMYHAKELGRNNYQYFTHKLLEKKNEYDQLMDAFKTAMAQEQLFLRYEPVFDLTTKKIVTIEALLRWQHPEKGELLPEKFLPIAEEIGLLPKIQQWFLQAACQQASQWFAAGQEHVKLLINLPYRQLLYKDFQQLLQQILDESQLPVQQLEIELESKDMLTIAYPKPLEKVIKNLDALGIGIVINDFGVGFSSLANLKGLPIKGLKISQTFIAQLLTNSNDAMIVKSIITLCKNLNLDVIADGIEVYGQYQFLIDNDCHKGQGTYLSEALTVESMTKFLT